MKFHFRSSENCKIFSFLQEIAFNIQQTEALTRSLSPSNAEQANFSRSASHTSFDTQSLRRNKQRLEEEQAYARSLAEQVKICRLSDRHSNEKNKKKIIPGMG